MGDPGPGVDQSGELALREMDGMRQDGPLTEAARAVVDIGVVQRLRKEPANLGDLERVLRQVRLPPSAGRPCQRHRLAQHLGRARDRKPRRDGIPQPATVGPVPAGNEVGGLAQGTIEDRRRFDRRVVGLAIHHDLAQDRPDPVGFRRPERDLHRGLVDDPIGQHGRRPCRREGLENSRRQTGGDSRVGPRALGREGQPVEPREEVQREAEARIRKLRQVGVEIDHPGEHDEGSEVVGGRRLGRAISRRSHEREAPGLVDENQPVGLVVGAAGREGRQQARTQRKGGAEWQTLRDHEGRC